MTSITTQQTKLDLELVPKENRFDIGKCNGRIPRGFSPREPTFQVVLDAIALTPCYPAFLIMADVPEICPRVQGQDFDPLPFEEDTVSFLRDLGHNGVINSLNDVVVYQMHQPWRTFAALINRSLSGKTTGLDKLRFSRAQIIWEASQRYEAVLPDCLISPKMKENKAYKTYLGFATGAVPLKVVELKKALPIGIIIREPPVTTKTKGKGKEKVDVAHGKGIELLSDVSLTDKALMKEVRKKSLRDFHKTHPGGSGTTAKEPPSVEKTTPTVISEGTSDKPGVPDVTNDDSYKSETESWGNDEDDSNEEQESGDEVSDQEKASDEQELDSKQDDDDDDDQENEESDHENESEDDETKSDEGDQGMDDTTDQVNDDVDTRLEEPTQTTNEIVQGEGTKAEMTEAQQGNENLSTNQEQVVEDAHVTISTVPKKIEGLVASSSLSSDLATKFLNFSDIPQTDAEIVSPLDIHVHHEVPRS
ncbi:hypothetical protein Tco_1409268 [Tanacetum coccineum]